MNSYVADRFVAAGQHTATVKIVRCYCAVSDTIGGNKMNSKPRAIFLVLFIAAILVAGAFPAAARPWMDCYRIPIFDCSVPGCPQDGYCQGCYIYDEAGGVEWQDNCA